MKTHKSYKGNLVKLRKRRERILNKKHELTLQLKKYYKLSLTEIEIINKNLLRLSTELNFIDKEILKIQNAMQNSGNWMDGDYNTFSIG